MLMADSRHKGESMNIQRERNFVEIELDESDPGLLFYF